MPGRIKAIWLLALALLRTWVRRLFERRRDGIAEFRDNYDADRLPAVRPDERLRMEGFGGCIACAVCDRGEVARIEASGGAYRGVMALMLAAARSMPDFHGSALAFAHVPDEALEEKEASCPTRVPMRDVARFVREKARELERSLPPPPVGPRRLPARGQARGP